MSRLAFILLSICAAAPLTAQQTYTAGKVVFNNLGTFTQEQLETAAGIHTGTTFTADDLGADAQRLVDTGYFDDVGASLTGKFNAMTVNFDIKPTPRSQMVHVAFENFVWLTHAEIEAAIKARFPLFNDYLSEERPKQDIVKQAVTDVLATKGVSAQVAFDTAEPTLHHPVREIEFTVVKPSIRVANVKLAGVSTDLVPYIQKSVNSTARSYYIEGPADETTADRILAPLLDAGYVQASLTDVVVTPGAAADGSIGIVLAATLNAGEVYHLSTLTFAGTPLLSSEAFMKTATLHTGDVASRKSLIDTLTPLDAAYRRQGYMDVTITAHPDLDTAKHTVGYVVTAEPGEQYRIKEVTTKNLGAAAQADFDRGWRMKTGELYNPEYARDFLKSNTALQALAGYSAGYKAYASPATHTVDLVITFYKSGGA